MLGTMCIPASELQKGDRMVIPHIRNGYGISRVYPGHAAQSEVVYMTTYEITDVSTYYGDIRYSFTYFTRWGKEYSSETSYPSSHVWVIRDIPGKGE